MLFLVAFSLEITSETRKEFGQEKSTPFYFMNYAHNNNNNNNNNNNKTVLSKRLPLKSLSAKTQFLIQKQFICGKPYLSVLVVFVVMYWY